MPRRTPRGRAVRGVARDALPVAAWVLGGVVAWAVVVGITTPFEIVVAGAAAALAFGVQRRAAEEAGIALHVRALAGCARSAMPGIAGEARAWGRLARSRATARGGFRRAEAPGGDAACRGVAIVVASLLPTSYVADAHDAEEDTDAGLMLLHDLPRRRRGERSRGHAGARSGEGRA